MPAPIHIIGGGLAGSEAAWQIAEAGLTAVLHEMRPVRPTAAHQTDRLAELVCSNSLKSEQEDSAPWLLKRELRRLGSLGLQAAAQARVPGGHRGGRTHGRTPRNAARAPDRGSPDGSPRGTGLQQLTQVRTGRLRALAAEARIAASSCSDL